MTCTGAAPEWDEAQLPEPVAGGVHVVSIETGRELRGQAVPWGGKEPFEGGGAEKETGKRNCKKRKCSKKSSGQ